MSSGNGIYVLQFAPALVKSTLILFILYLGKHRFAVLLSRDPTTDVLKFIRTYRWSERLHLSGHMSANNTSNDVIAEEINERLTHETTQMKTKPCLENSV